MIRKTLDIAPGRDDLPPKSASEVATAKPPFFMVPSSIMQLESLRSIFSLLVMNSYRSPSPIMVTRQMIEILPSVSGSLKKTLRLRPMAERITINRPQFTTGPLNFSIYLLIFSFINICDSKNGNTISSANTIISLSGWIKLWPTRIIPDNGIIIIAAIYAPIIPMSENFTSPPSILVNGGIATPGGAKAIITKPIQSSFSGMINHAIVSITAAKTK